MIDELWFWSFAKWPKIASVFLNGNKKVDFWQKSKRKCCGFQRTKKCRKETLKMRGSKRSIHLPDKKSNEVFLHEWQINLLIFLLGWGNNFAASTKIFNVADISWQDMKTYGSVNFTKIIIFYYFQIQPTDFWATIHIRIISNFWEKMVKVYSLELEMSFTTSAYLPYKKMWNR